MTNYCKENTGMVIHTDSFANERRFVCILKCRRTRHTRVVSGWSCVSDERVAPSHPPPPSLPPPPQKKDDDKISLRFHVSD